LRTEGAVEDVVESAVPWAVADGAEVVVVGGAVVVVVVVGAGRG
jgi:hypothetical protein